MNLKKLIIFGVILTALFSMLDFGNALASSIVFGSKVTVFSNVGYQAMNIKKLSDTKVIAVYIDTANNNMTTAKIGTISGSSISWGDPYVFSTNGGYSAVPDVTVLDSTKAVVGFYSTSQGEVRVATISGNAISFGAKTIFESASVSDLSLITLSSTKIAINYIYQSGNLGGSKIATISGTNISVGSLYNYDASNNTNLDSVALSDSKFAVVYARQSSSYNGAAIIGNVSGSTISFGSYSIYNNTGTTFSNNIVALSSTKVMVNYADISDSSKGKSIIADVSGTTFAWGSEYTFNDGDTTAGLGADKFDSSNVIIAYGDKGNSTKGTAIEAKISGKIISYSSEYVFESGRTGFSLGNGVASLDNSKFVAGFREIDQSNRGSAIVGTFTADVINNTFADTPTSLAINTGANHTIALTSKTGAESSSDTITVTFPSGFSLASGGNGDHKWAFIEKAYADGRLDYTDVDLSHGPVTGYETEETLAATASASAWGASFTGNVLTLTHPTSAGVGDILPGDKVIIEIGTNATGGDQQVINPGAQGEYIIVVDGTWGDSGQYALSIQLSDQVAVTATIDPTLSFVLSSNTFSFGHMLVNTVNDPTGGAISMTVNTNAANGYSVSIKDQGNGASPGMYSSSLNALIASSSTTLSAGTEGYGLAAKSATETVSATYNYDYDVNENVGGLSLNSTGLVSNTGPVSNAITYMMVKTALSSTTKAGEYGDTLTLICTANF